MADVLTFDPASEFEILETIADFEEDVQRPEELRFFTLDEQLLDYQSKVLSGKKKISKYEVKKVYNEVSRLRDIYSTMIVFGDMDSGYIVDTERKSVNVPWVTPIYSNFEYVSYPYAENWMPLMDRAQNNNPNYYNRLLVSLPKPFKTTDSSGRMISEKTTLVNEDGKNPIQALGLYTRTKGVIHEDGTFDVIPLPMLNTGDDIRIKGFHLGKRSMEIPNPLKDHPFLASNNPLNVLTTDTLLDIFPSVQAIMNHGVKTTTDPYGEGLEYLKVYDVKLSQIPWKLWKERFPPADQVSSSPTILSISFPDQGEVIAPSENIRKQYVNPWFEGVFPRQWLMKQEDGGLLTIKMYLSKVGQAGLVPPEIQGEKVKPSETPSTPDECLVTDNFDSFLNSGVYRSPSTKVVSEAVDKNKTIPAGTCITADYLQQEIVGLTSAGKVAWRETSGAELLEEYIKLLRKSQVEPQKPTDPKYEKYGSRPESEIRKDIVTILNDPDRTPEDKATDIQTIVNMIMPINEVYFDKDESFIVCNHTLSELRGDLEDDRLGFYRRWTAIVDGSRICKFCGEQVNTDVLVAQDDFDSNGKVVVNYDALETQVFAGDHNISSFATSIKDLGKLFTLENPGEATLYLILSLLQVLPTEGATLPVLQYIRKLATVLRANKKIEISARQRVEGITGLVGAVILLQTHTPFLLPRRSIGGRVFKTSGFPRDTTDSAESPVLDNILSVLRATFEEFPTTFSGGVVSLFRSILATPKRVRDETVRFLGQAATEFKPQFEAAKERYVAPTAEEEVSLVTLPIIKLEKLEYSPSERLGAEELTMKCGVSKPLSILASRLLPKVSQDPIELAKNIVPASQATYIQPPVLEIKKISFDDKEIRKRLAMKFAKITKSDKIEKFLARETIDVVSILTLTNRILDILSLQNFKLDVLKQYRSIIAELDTRKSASLLRDTAKGILYELSHEISKDKNKASLGKAIDDALLKDVVMNMLLYTDEEAKRISEAARTKERETFKQKMRSMNDTQREITKMLLDVGVAAYIITNEDRETFAREYNYPDPEEEYNKLVQQLDEQKPEDGYNDTRDYVEDGVRPLNVLGQEMEVDTGGYGDRAVRPYDDYANMVGDADFDNGYGE
jgi:hypothetical protein